MKLKSHAEAPLITHIKQAKKDFHSYYGIHAEKIHMSRKMAHAFQRWAMAENYFPKSMEERLNGMEILGLGVFHMTKNTPKVEFYLSATRGVQVYSLNCVIEPEAAGLKKTTGPEIIIATDGEPQ